MDDSELNDWGRFGRGLTDHAQSLAPPGKGSLIDLWNAFGALEEKVRNGS